MNILFTCAGRRHYLLNYFKEALGSRGKIIATDMQLSAPALQVADVAIKVPAIYDDLYIENLINIIKQHNIKAVISLNDLELPILSKYKKILEANGAKVLVSNEDIIDTTFDKIKSHDFIQKIGLLSPKTYDNLEQAEKLLNSSELELPLVVKPRWGSASIGIEFPETERELKLSYELLALRLKRTILAKASEADYKNSILIQEKIDGIEYGMDILNDFNGNYVSTFVRKKLAMRAGETDKAISIIDPRFEKIGKKIGEQLKHIGNLDCDILEKDNKLYVLELNPRFGGGYPFSHEAGANIANLYVDWLLNKNTKSNYIQYKANLTFAKYDRLVNVTSK